MILLCNMLCEDFCYRFFGLGNYFVCKTFTVQTLLWSLEFVIQINLELDTNTENTHQVSCYHFFIVEIIAESVNLIQMSK